MEKVCSKCGSTNAGFSKDKSRPDGLKDCCKTCDNKRRTKHRLANLDKNKEKSRAKQWRIKFPEKSRAATRLYCYNLSNEAFDELLSKQDNKCAICNKLFSDTVKVVIDHDHSCCKGRRSCGKCIRGLLCFKCNAMLGYALDNAATLQNASQYLTGRYVV